MNPRRHRFTSKSGLSLFELLIALALLAFISMALVSSFSLGTRLFVKSTEIAALSDELALRARLRVWLGAATPPSLLTGSALKFEGQSDGLTFVTLMPTPFAPNAAGLTISLISEGNTLSLTALAFDDDGKEISHYSGILAREAQQISFGYYASAGGVSGWHDVWTDTARLPDLVRIEMSESSQPDWPEFTVQMLMGR